MSLRRTTTRTSRRDGPPTNTTTTFSTLYRKTTGGTGPARPGHAARGLHEHQCRGDGVLVGHVEHTGRQPGVPHRRRPAHGRNGPGHEQRQLGADRRDGHDAAGEPERQCGRVADADIHEHCGYHGRAERQPARSDRRLTNPSATITFLDAAARRSSNPVLQNGIAATVRVRITQSGTGIKYTDVAVPLASAPRPRTTTLERWRQSVRPASSPTASSACRGAHPANGTLTVSSTRRRTARRHLPGLLRPEHQRDQPAVGHQPVRLDDRWIITVAAGLADLSITKTDSPDPVAPSGTLTYTIGVTQRRPERASAVKVVDTLPAGTTFVAPTGRTGPASTFRARSRATAPAATSPPAPRRPSRSSSRPRRGRLDHQQRYGLVAERQHPGNNTATATTRVNAPNTPPCLRQRLRGDQAATPCFSDTVVCTDTTSVRHYLTYSVVTTIANGVLTFNSRRHVSRSSQPELQRPRLAHVTTPTTE